MCMAIPSLVISLEGNVATVECFGVRRTVNTVLMSEPVSPGDYASVMANTYVIEKVPSDVAAESLAYLQEILSEPVVTGDKR